jgi:hypothetical protein
MTWYLPSYSMAPSLPLMTPTNQKSLPYLIYNVGTKPDAHVWVFRKAIQANGERNDLNIFNLFCFTLKDVILEWGEIFIQSHPNYTFVKLEATICKCY